MITPGKYINTSTCMYTEHIAVLRGEGGVICELNCTISHIYQYLVIAVQYRCKWKPEPELVKLKI
jgi:hypothetical protein